MKRNSFFITATNTGAGKTFFSAIICEALKSDYWKPVQAGNLSNSDSIKVKNLISNKKSKIHKERYKLKLAASPHYAAKKENLIIKIDDFNIPKTNNNIIIEGAGGILVPLNEDGLLLIDLIKKFNLPVILVSNLYLGSINHSLMSIELLKKNNIKIAFIVFIGDIYNDNIEIILKYSKIDKFFHIHNEKEINKKTVKKWSEKLIKSNILNLI